jgi:SAM-dependent methyltransferase
VPADARLWERLAAPLRRLRWAASAWSTHADRDFHDAQFTALDRDPFSPSYPGYLTIRRFADHAERCFDDVRSVLDLGCGPGEITCELARRHPDVQFAGIDHSEVGITTAREHAARLRLANATFDVRDVEQFRPAAPVDLVMMFDAFHHVLDPAELVGRLRPFCSKFFLVEPAGTWSGGWNRTQDLDWLSETIGQIRQRLEYQFGLDAEAHAGPPPARPAAGAVPTEHRYTVSDFERFFDGAALDIRGTIAGLERYGPRPGDRSPLRDRVGTLTYDLVSALEQLLFDHELDLAAKHWAISATYGAAPPGLTRRARTALPVRAAAPALLPPYAVEYGQPAGPDEAGRGESFRVRVRLTNRGWLTWDSAGTSPVFVSYHWEDGQGHSLIHDGARTPFAEPIAPDSSAEVDLVVTAPDSAGRATLVIDLVHEGQTWFSEQGVTPLRREMRIGP